MKTKKRRTYSGNELPHHAGPGAVGPGDPVVAVPHQPDAILELEDVAQLLQHVHAEALVAVVALQHLVVGPQHHVRVLLKQHQQHSGLCTRRGGEGTGTFRCLNSKKPVRFTEFLAFA